MRNAAIVLIVLSLVAVVSIAQQPVGSVYNSPIPSATPGNVIALQGDPQGRVIDAPLQVGAGGTVNLSGVPVAPSTTVGNIKPGLAPQQGGVILGQYNLNLPILSGGQTVGLQTDNAGRLLISSVNALPPVQLAPLSRGIPAVSLPPVSYPSYHATQTLTLASSATDFACLPGNPSNIVIVDEAHMSGIQTTAGVLAIFLLRRSTADTGTSNAIPAVADDANYPAAVSAPVYYTANPAVGTLFGYVDSGYVGFMASGTAASNDIYIGSFKAKPLILRGTAQELCFNLNGVTVTGGNVAVEFHWYEVVNLASFTP